MKKLLILVMVLAMASLASATLSISVNGDVPTGDITLVPSDFVTLDVHSDGQDLADAGAFLVVEGPGMVDISGAVNNYLPNTNGDTLFIWSGDPLVGDGVFMDFTALAVPAPVLPAGILVDGIIFHCEGPGDVVVSLYMFRGELQLMDTQVIHQVPEPVTIALLGLGGLFLRRRMA